MRFEVPTALVRLHDWGAPATNSFSHGSELRATDPFPRVEALRRAGHAQCPESEDAGLTVSRHVRWRDTVGPSRDLADLF